MAAEPTLSIVKPDGVGKNLIGLKDIDGKEFVKERVELAKAKGTFWQDYKFTNPVSKKVEPKAMYCEKLDETVVCGGGCGACFNRFYLPAYQRAQRFRSAPRSPRVFWGSSVRRAPTPL